MRISFIATVNSEKEADGFIGERGKEHNFEDRGEVIIDHVADNLIASGESDEYQ